MSQNLYVFLAVVRKTEDILNPGTKKRKKEINKHMDDGELNGYGYLDDALIEEGDESSGYQFVGIQVGMEADLLRDENLLIDMNDDAFQSDLKKAIRKFKQLTGLDGELRVFGRHSY